MEIKPATEKQLAKLQLLGYQGNTEGLTTIEATVIITELEKNQGASATYPQPSATPGQTKQEVVAATPNQVDFKEKNISDSVLKSVKELQDAQGLVLPVGYNPTNALKSAYLKLAEQGYLNTDQTALAQALLNMCIQGLNTGKNQCYFINYGGKVNMMRSYFGDRTVLLNYGLVKDVQANIIYEGDEVNIWYENDYMKVEHKTSWQNYGKTIVGAYAFAVLPDGRKIYDIMQIDRIKKSWAMSKNNANNKLQNTFTDDACKRTVIRHLAKNIFNQTADSDVLVRSYNESTENEYDHTREFKYDNQNDVEAKQKENNATIKVDENGVINA